jgi:2-keto-4-pentenoate hydratase
VTPATTVHDSERVAEALGRLTEARRTGVPCAPVRPIIGDADLPLAYEVQSAWVRGELEDDARIVGHKIGLTSPAVQTQLGVDQPDFGVLLDTMDRSGDADIAMDGLLQPRIEAEIAFVLSQGLFHPPFSDERLYDAVDHVVAALEICDSRISGWDIRITDTVADNASSALFVLGDAQVTLHDFVPKDASMSLTKNGVVASEGDGRACLGDPINALRWLAETAVEHGEPLKAGDVVLSGALGPMVNVQPGDEFIAEISGLGRVRARFASADDE